MAGSLVGLLITLLIVGVIWWAFTQLIGLIPLPPPIAQIVNVILVVIIALIIINALAGILGAGIALPTLHWH